MQAFLSKFVYSRRTKAIFAQGQEALLHLREQNKKLIAELSKANVTVEKATNMIGLAAGSLKQAENYKRTRDDEAAKLWEELQREKVLREEAWATVEDEC